MSSTDPTVPSADTARQELISALVRASFATTAVLSRIAAEHDLSLTQLRVLAILRDRRVRMSELADYLGLDKSTISGLVDRAEKRGLIQRAPSPADGRATDVFLTAEGMQLAELGERKIAESLSPMTGKLTRAESRRLTGLLEHVLEQEGLSWPHRAVPGLRAGAAAGCLRQPI
jgi:DNA-binding MarR family transcriptional regulator